MKLYATRLQEGEDLKHAVSKFVQSKRLANAVIVSAVGSLSVANIRMAGATPGRQDVRMYEGAFEIVSLFGTVDKNGQSHLHISISDKDGKTTGGHLKDGCIVHTTVELVIASDKNLEFERLLDSRTGFDELSVIGV